MIFKNNVSYLIFLFVGNPCWGHTDSKPLVTASVQKSEQPTDQPKQHQLRNRVLGTVAITAPVTFFAWRYFKKSDTSSPPSPPLVSQSSQTPVTTSPQSNNKAQDTSKKVSFDQPIIQKTTKPKSSRETATSSNRIAWKIGDKVHYRLPYGDQKIYKGKIVDKSGEGNSLRLLIKEHGINSHVYIEPSSLIHNDRNPKKEPRRRHKKKYLRDCFQTDLLGAAVNAPSGKSDTLNTRSQSILESTYESTYVTRSPENFWPDCLNSQNNGDSLNSIENLSQHPDTQREQNSDSEPEENLFPNYSLSLSNSSGSTLRLRRSKSRSQADFSRLPFINSEATLPPAQSSLASPPSSPLSRSSSDKNEKQLFTPEEDREPISPIPQLKDDQETTHSLSSNTTNTSLIREKRCTTRIVEYIKSIQHLLKKRNYENFCEV